MASTYSALKLQLMATGENLATWGSVTNVNLGTALEEMVAGSADVTFASGTVTLTLTDTNATQTARNMRLNLTGTSGGAQNLVVPAVEKVYIVKNGCADTITIKNATGTGVAIPAGKSCWVYNDGTNVTSAVNFMPLSTTLGFAATNIAGGTQSVSTGVVTQVNLGTELYDVGGTFTGSTHTPTTAGVYEYTGTVAMGSGGSLVRSEAFLYKNGALYSQLGGANGLSGSGSSAAAGGTLAVSMNGSTDTMALHAVCTATSPTFLGVATSGVCYFSGKLVST